MAVATELLLLGQAAVDEDSAAYEIGQVFGSVIVVVLILAGIYLLGAKLLGKGTKAGGVPAGWYDDPDGGADKRWWDGERWTEGDESA